MSNTTTAQGIVDLPAGLAWLQEKVNTLMRPAAFMVQDPKAIAPQGGTFTRGAPDEPVDKSWPNWSQAPQDGPSFWLQLNLEDIPAQVRQPHWPQVGVVWLFLDLSGESWEADVYFDPRPAGQIPWKPRRIGVEPPTVVRWELRATLPDATDEALPEISQDWRSPDGLCHQYTDWVQAQFRAPSDIQVGGWAWPCQGDFDERNRDFVMSFRRQAFGDSGEVSLHFDPARGFYAFVDTH